MPQIQWLGDIDTSNSGGGYLAKALGEGIGGAVKGYFAGKERAKEREIKGRELEMQESELELKKKEILLLQD